VATLLDLVEEPFDQVARAMAAAWQWAKPARARIVRER
jgi:hypothetical protein